MKKTIILIMICLSMCVVGCAKEDNNHMVVDADSLRFPDELLEGTDEQVRYIRENVSFNQFVISQDESCILSEADRHPTGETCQNCGKHADYLRKESVDVNIIEQIEQGMTVCEVFDLIGNPHLKCAGYYQDPHYSRVNLIYYNDYYYVLSDGNVLEVHYDLDSETEVETAKLKTIAAAEFIEMYASRGPLTQYKKTN